MPIPINIQTIDDIPVAIETAIGHLGTPEQEIQVTVNPELTISIRLCGESWDGMVDYRIADFVGELQRSVDRARIENYGSESSRIIVKLRVKDGSTELETQVLQLLEKLSTNMTSTQQFILALVVVGAGFGLFTIPKVLEHFRTQKETDVSAEKDQASIAALTDVTRLAIEKIDSERSIRMIAKSMDREDKIVLPGSPDPLSRDEVRALYPRKRRVTPIDVQLDDNFHVESVAIEVPVKLSVTRADITFKAEFSPVLGVDDRDAFLQRIKAAIETGATLRVALQMDARINERGVVHALIVGIAKPPRDGAQGIDDLFDI